jgi:hypothetical protein
MPCMSLLGPIENIIHGRSSFEVDIARHLSSDPLSKDSRNHCVLLLDVLHPPLKDGDRDLQVLVMPFLRPFDSPIFDTFGEAIDCIRQLFEVRFSTLFRKHHTTRLPQRLQFTHENRVAHRYVFVLSSFQNLLNLNVLGI